MDANDNDTQSLVDAAVETMLEAEQSYDVRAYEVGEEWAAVFALRATSLLEYFCAVSLTMAERKRHQANKLVEQAELRRPSGRRVHTVAESKEIHERATRTLERAVAAESTALSALGAPDLAEARHAVAYITDVESAHRARSSDEEWGLALDVAKRVQARRKKMQRWKFVRGRAEQASQPRGGLLPLARFDRIELGGVPLTLNTETGNSGTIASAVELLARWDLAEDPRANTTAYDAALEAIRAVRRGEHTESGPGRVAAMARQWNENYDAFEEMEWLDSEDDSDETFAHINEMRARVSRWFERFGRPVRPGTWAVNSERFHLDGHIDFVTADTIWDLKVSVTAPSSRDVLQLLLYWVAFCDDPENVYEITHLGIYNPRMDIVWRIAVAAVPPDVIATVTALALNQGP